MKQSLVTVVVAALAALTAPAQAALDIGDKAPDFAIDSSLAGSVTKFHLTEALKKGPVVLYFFPAAFSVGCTIEANKFAEATDEYRTLGATVIGVSHDDIETLKKFSTTECRNKFAVGADVDQSVMKSYDAVLALKPDYANRTSYVISPDGKIVYQFTSLNPLRHVANTMAALKGWVAQKKQ
ncbi:peroxiredoxin [Aquincola sp. S2]|uniref:thioredoxin-dependent peroxiredoxin n=1 Tax=Pseudaquabacterium terrae TaxID=2732868 RepID=A0ABX2EJJ0_9BURK|nr:peroxiredoxin [Aquabacterium terrae]NRF68746.1 peroxiredoxin [Aquabacterium terrae]